jgi:transcriptional regulator with XRE-family HTH domain
MKVKLKILRIKKGMSIKALAQASGVSEPTIGRIENENAFPHATTLLKLAKALGVSMDELIVETEEDRLLKKAG